MAVETITPGEIHKHARQWEHTALTTELLLASGVVVLSILGIARSVPNLSGCDRLSSGLARSCSSRVQPLFCITVSFSTKPVLQARAALRK